MTSTCRFRVLYVPTGIRRRAAVLVGLLALGLGPLGCQESSDVGFDDLGKTPQGQAWREDYLQYAVSNLNRLDQFGPDDMEQQIVDRLNQWIQAQPLPPDWKPDPLVAALPAALDPAEQMEALQQRTFLRSDGPALQAAVWLRDVSNWARGDRLDDLTRTRRLFDWVVRNVQLEPDPADPASVVPNRPWETLLLGRGTALDRAWVFMLLLRHQDIDSVLLAVPRTPDASHQPAEDKPPADKPADNEPTDSDRALLPWAVGVLIQDQLYLFDPALGLPIPAPDGVRFDEEGQLDLQPATLAQAAADEAVLAGLGVEGAAPYPVRHAQLKNVVAFVAASPESLSARMEMLQARMAGTDKVLLAVRPSDVATRIKAVPGMGDVRLWPWPFEVARRHAHLTPAEADQVAAVLRPFRVGRDSRLWRGRTRHLKGELTGEHGATFYYQQARPPSWRQAEIREATAKEAPTPEEARQIAEAFRRGKQDASYWLGLVSAVLGKTDAAIDYFAVRTLKADPDGPWTQGAYYNLARLLESQGRRSEAIEIYEQNAASPAGPGSLLRAKWLRAAKPGVLPGQRL